MASIGAYLALLELRPCAHPQPATIGSMHALPPVLLRCGIAIATAAKTPVFGAADEICMWLARPACCDLLSIGQEIELPAGLGF